MANDSLARGARSATYGYSGKPGEEIELRNVSPEGRDLEADTVATVAPTAPRKKFSPAGHQILVRQSQAVDKGKTYTDQATALNDKSSDIVLIRDEEAKKADAPAEGFVVSTGPGSDEYEMTVAVGDNIVFGKYSGAAFNLNGEWLLLMGVNEVLGTLSDEVVEEETEVVLTAPLLSPGERAAAFDRKMLGKFVAEA